jgi:hypothetical protein
MTPFYFYTTLLSYIINWFLPCSSFEATHYQLPHTHLPHPLRYLVTQHGSIADLYSHPHQNWEPYHSASSPPVEGSKAGLLNPSVATPQPVILDELSH